MATPAVVDSVSHLIGVALCPLGVLALNPDMCVGLIDVVAGVSHAPELVAVRCDRPGFRQ